MWSSRNEAVGHVGNANSPAYFGAVRQRDIYPFVAGGLAQTHGTEKRVRVRRAQGAFGSVNFDAWEIVAPDGEAHQNRTHGAVDEIENARIMRRNLDRHFRAGQRLAGDESFGKTDARRGGDALDWADEGHQRGEVIRAHVVHRAAPGLVVKLGARVPG